MRVVRRADKTEENKGGAVVAADDREGGKERIRGSEGRPQGARARVELGGGGMPVRWLRDEDALGERRKAVRGSSFGGCVAGLSGSGLISSICWRVSAR
jgi:hypothetical protein